MHDLAILIFDEVEILDFCGPYEVFSVASYFVKEEEKKFNVFLIAEQIKPVIAKNGLSINPDYSLERHPQFDILLLPGGKGTRREINNDKLINWIILQEKRVDYLLSVCTGALLLAKAKLLDQLTITTHWGALDLLKKMAPNSTIDASKRYHDNGKIITSAGISAGIDMSLFFVEKILGSDIASKTARQMEYNWKNEYN